MSIPYCIYNAIKTPDGTVLWCQTSHDYQTHHDKVSGELYMNDGLGYMIRRSLNNMPYEDLSIHANEPHEKVRTAPFWGAYGKDGKNPRVVMALKDMEDSHIEAILDTQRQIKGTVLETLFKNEQKYRKMLMAQEFSEKLPEKKNKTMKHKV